MEIKYEKVTGVPTLLNDSYCLVGEAVWDGYNAIANGKIEFEIRKIKSKWHLVKKDQNTPWIVSQVFKTLREAKAQFEKAMERKYENRT